MQKLHYNKPQLKLLSAMTQLMYAVWGRGTGKTEVAGNFLAENMTKMPRSTGAVVGVTYTSLLTKLVPGIIRCWQKMGYIEGVHFWVNKYPPKSFNVPTPIRPTLSPKHTIFWYNGSYIQLLSLKNMNNGMDADHLFFDEARFLPYEKVREIILTVRGNRTHFGNMSCHGSMLFCTDMPRSSEQKWIMEKEKEMDKNKIDVILKTHCHVTDLKLKLRSAKSQREKTRLEKSIRKFEKHLNELRRGTIYFSRATSLDNIHVLGVEALKNWKRTLTPLDYRISVLNEEINKVEGGFYGLFDEMIHGYVDENESFIKKLELDYSKEVKKNCSWDNDLLNAPLDIACDHNASINWCVIGQYEKRLGRDRVKNALYVKHPLRIKDLVKKVADYYQPHPCKVINYYFDHTSTAENAQNELDYSWEITKEFQKLGWRVNRKYIGQANRHNALFLLWQDTFKGEDQRLPKFEINRANCADLIIGVDQAEAKQTNIGVGLEKKYEKIKEIDQVYTTHGCEALNIYWGGKYLSRMAQQSGDFIPLMY